MAARERKRPRRKTKPAPRKSLGSRDPVASDVFISYTRPDWNSISPCLRLLEEIGLSYSCDREIPAGTAFPAWLQGQIGDCKAVVVFLSRRSIAQQWVRDEVFCAHELRKPMLAVEIEPIDNRELADGLLIVLGDVQRASFSDPAFATKLLDWLSRRFAKLKRGAIKQATSVTQAIRDTKALVEAGRWQLAHQRLREIPAGELTVRQEATARKLAAEVDVRLRRGDAARSQLWRLREISVRHGVGQKPERIDQQIRSSILRVDSGAWAGSAEKYHRYLQTFTQSIQIRLCEYITSQIQAFILRGDRIGDILDLCCGTGILGRLLCEQGVPVRVAGYDIKEMVDIAHRWKASLWGPATPPEHTFYDVRQSWITESHRGESFDAAVMNMAIFQFGLQERLVLLRDLGRALRQGAWFWVSTDGPDFVFPDREDDDPVNQVNDFKPKLMDVLRDAGHVFQRSPSRATSPTFRKDTIDSIRYLLEPCGFELLTTSSTLPVVESNRSGDERIAFHRLPVISEKVFGREIPGLLWDKARESFAGYRDTVYGAVLLARRTGVVAPYLFVKASGLRQANEDILFASAAVIRNARGNTLMVHRGRHVRDFPNTWSLPSAMAEPGRSLKAPLDEVLRDKLGLDGIHLSPLAVRVVRRDEKLFVMCLFEGATNSAARLRHRKYTDLGWRSGRHILGLPPEGIGECIICYQDILRSQSAGDRGAGPRRTAGKSR